MNIKEVERITGMSRANIRYYETEGLITPARNENGYRDYSPYDIEVLNKIKLLRLLHVSIEDIKSLEHGKENLRDIMEVNAMKLEGKIKQFETSKKISEHMAQSQIDFDKLLADDYLAEIDQANDRKYIAKNLSQDKSNYDFFEWRRYLARSIDISIYDFLLIILGLKYNFLRFTFPGIWNEVCYSIILMIAIILIEPIMLALFKTTPGKWLFGLRVEHTGNRTLTYAEGFKRTCILMVKGLGLGIPIIDLWREYDSFLVVSEGKLPSWESQTSSYTRPLPISGFRITFIIMVYITYIVLSEVFVFN